MKKIWLRFRIFAILVASVFVMGGCVSNQLSNSSGELPTSSDQTDSQKRARIRLQLAVGYYEQRQLDVALDEIKQALQADLNLADAYSMRALIYMEMGETRLADDNFLHAIRIAPNNPDFNNNYGWFLCQNHRENQSLSYFENALKNRSYQSPAKALNNAGVCSLRLKDQVAAEGYFSRAFQYDPANPITNTNLAKIYYDRRDYEKSRFYIARVTKTEAINADALWLAIKVEHKLGDRAVESSLVTQLRRRYLNSPEYAACQRGAFDD